MHTQAVDAGIWPKDLLATQSGFLPSRFFKENVASPQVYRISSKLREGGQYNVVQGRASYHLANFHNPFIVSAPSHSLRSPPQPPCGVSEARGRSQWLSDEQ